MARNTQRRELNTARDVSMHFDQWAASALKTPEAWEQALIDAQSWLDYSARNQLFLASYGASGYVAGEETWRLVPSNVEGRSCAVRGGEHGYPIKVPVVTRGDEPDPYVGGRRPTRSAAENFEWRPVFSVEQLARKPAPDSLVPVEVPDSLRGPGAEAAFLEAARKVATATVRGRLKGADDPYRVLAEAAGRMPRNRDRPELDPVLRRQVAWLVADRVGLAPTDRLPRFDPSRISPRERWERMWDVLEPSGKLIGALGKQIGVDLTASPLPRMEIVDDRVVAAGRRNRLPAASLERLPIGKWVEVGPYTVQEWAARGEEGVGAGAFYRLNKSAYLSVVEHTDGANWRLEDVASRTGHGLLTTGTAESLDAARESAVAAVRDRYPVLTAENGQRAAVTGPGSEWEPMPGSGRTPAEMRRMTDDITVYVMAGPGGRWQPALHSAAIGALERLPLQPDAQAARDAALAAGLREARLAAIADPSRADVTVAGFADSADYSRAELGRMIAGQLDQPRLDLLPDASPAELVELLGEAGFSPATTVAVLHAERIDADTAAGLLPIVGVPMHDAVRVLHERWELPRAEAAELVGASAVDMRVAGCTPVEIMAARPREVLRTLPTDPDLWGLAAGTMHTAGHPPATIASHLAAYAATPDAFANGITTIADEDAAAAVTLAARAHAPAEHVAAVAAVYDLSPLDTLVHAAVGPADTALDAATIVADGDRTAVEALAPQAGIAPADIDAWRAGPPATTVTPIRGIDHHIDADALLAALPAPTPTTGTNPLDRLDALSAQGVEPPTLEPTP